MIFTSNLARPARKAMGTKAQMSTVSKIIELLPMDPEVGGMEVVLLSPQDAIGSNRDRLNKALQSKHPDICSIYLYCKDNEKDMLACDLSFKVKKYTPVIIREVIENNVGNYQMIKTGKMKVSSADFEDPFASEDGIAPVPAVSATKAKEKKKLFGSKPKNVPAPRLEEEPDEEAFTNPADFNPGLMSEPEPEPEPLLMRAPVEQDTEPEPLQEPTPLPVEPPIEHPIPEPEPVQEEPPVPLDTASFRTEPVPSKTVINDSFIDKASNAQNFEVFKEMLQKNSIINKIVQENADYAATLSLLDALEARIEEIYRDPTLDSTAKFDQIREIGLNRSVLQATQNSISTERVINIITAIADSAKKIVDEKIKSIDDSVCRIATDRANLLDSVQIDKLLDARTETYLDLLNLGRGLVDLYKSMDTLVNDTINDLDACLPSKNEFINQMVKPIGPNVFTPTNSAELANALVQALTTKRISFSQLEDHLKTTCELISHYMTQSNEIILYQKQQLDLLKANRVEDVIIAPTALKRSLKLYVGTPNSGRSATAITWNGVLSRRQNTLLIDMTGDSKFETYGITPITYDQFMAERVESQYCCVKCDMKLDATRLQNLVEEISLRLNYYSNVGIILDASDVEAINILGEDALSIHYITDCRTQSIKALSSLAKKLTVTNIAQVLVTIDAPISPLSIADSTELDVTRLKIVSIPSMQQIRACAIRSRKPYDMNDVVRVFEGAFNL